MKSSTRFFIAPRGFLACLPSLLLMSLPLPLLHIPLSIHWEQNHQSCVNILSRKRYIDCSSATQCAAISIVLIESAIIHLI